MGGDYMAREFAQGFYRSSAWRHTRAAYTASTAGLCEQCLRKGMYRPGEIVHHITPITPDMIDDPRITLAWDNLMLLCRDCHARAHGNVRRYNVDETGRVILRR